MTALAPGERIPRFTAPDSTGYLWTQDDLMGHRVALSFQSAKPSPDGRAVLRGLRDHMPDFHALETLVVSVSGGSVETLARVVAQDRLPFPVLSDPRRVIARGFGVLVEGRVQALTFLIGPSGRIQRVYRTIDPTFHAAEVVRDILDVVRPAHSTSGARATAPVTQHL